MPDIGSTTAVARSTVPAIYRSGAAGELRFDEPAPTPSQAIHISPRLRFDREAALLVIEIRDVQSGELQRSIPNQSIVEAYRRASLTGEAVPGAPIDFREAFSRAAEKDVDAPKGASGSAGPATPVSSGDMVQSVNTAPAPATSTAGASVGGGGASAAVQLRATA